MREYPLSVKRYRNYENEYLVRRGVCAEGGDEVCLRSRAADPYRCPPEELLINRYCSSLNRPPQPSLREGIPALLRRGMALFKNTVGQHALQPAFVESPTNAG